MKFYKRPRFYATVVYAVFVLILFAYVFDVMYGVDYFWLNSPRQQIIQIPIGFDYYENSHQFPQMPDIIMRVTLYTNQSTIIENQPIVMDSFAIVNITTFNTNIQHSNITSIVVGFKHAYLANAPELKVTDGFGLQQGGTEILIPVHATLEYPYSKGQFFRPISISVIKWSVAGDYAPFFVLNFQDNHTAPIFTSETSVHVDTANVLQEERFSQVNQQLTVVLVAFALIESVVIGKEIYGDPHRESEPSNIAPNSEITKPDSKQKKLQSVEE